tara:strand:- start:2564 stop:3463 length:900 start_codon:yes stop_codon:yes gene_type:complete
MINAGLIFEMLSYSFVESSFHKDKERASLYYGLMEEHFHSDSPLLKEAFVFNTLLNAKARTSFGAKKIIESNLGKLPEVEELNPYYAKLIKSLRKKKVLQEIEDTFINIDNEYGNIFTLINFILESYYAKIDSKGRKKDLAGYLKNKKVRLTEKKENIFADKLGMLAFSKKEDFSSQEEDLLIEIFSTPQPLETILVERFDALQEGVGKEGELLTELGAMGKAAISGAVIALIVKKLSEIKDAILKTSKTETGELKNIEKAVASVDRNLKNMPTESAIDALLDYQELLTEMKSIVSECK